MLVRGILTLRRDRVRETRYVVRNRTGRAHTLYVEHRKAGRGYTLAAPAEPHEERAEVAQFSLPVPAGTEPVELLVREERPTSSEVEVASLQPNKVRWYAAQPYLSAKTRAFLGELAALMERWTAAEARLEELAAERGRLVADQQTARDNLLALRDGPSERALRERYVARLSRATERTDAIDAASRAARTERAELEAEFLARVRAFEDE